MACCGRGRHFCWVFSTFCCSCCFQYWMIVKVTTSYYPSSWITIKTTMIFFRNVCIYIYVGVTHSSHLIVFFQVWAFHLWRNSPKWQLQLGTLNGSLFRRSWQPWCHTTTVEAIPSESRKTDKVILDRTYFAWLGVKHDEKCVKPVSVYRFYFSWCFLKHWLVV